MKKIAFILSVVFAFSITCSVSAESNFTYNDDFESYQLMNVMGRMKTMPGNDYWLSGPVMGWESDDLKQAYFGITQKQITFTDNYIPNVTDKAIGDNDTNVLYLQAKAEAGKYDMIPAIGFCPTENTDIINRCIKVDMYSPSNDIRLGVRFNADKTNANYYELYFNASSYTLYKCVNGARSRIDIGKSGGQLPSGIWYTLELKIFNGEISWDLYNRNSGTKLEQYCGGTYDDSLRNATSYSKYPVQLIAAGRGAAAGYFDNFSISKYLGPWAENSEPYNQLYRKLETQKDENGIYDIGFASKVRKISIKNPSSEIQVMLSNDKSNFVTACQGTNDSDFVLLNSTMVDKYRYVKILGTYDSAELFDDITEPIDACLGKNVYLAARFNKEDIDNATWTSDNTEVCEVTGGTVTTKKTGTAKITATSGTKNLTVDINVLTEYDFYHNAGMDEEYILNHRAPMDKFNAAVKAKDCEQMKQLLLPDTECSLKNIDIIEFDKISALDDEHINYLSSALINYDSLYADNENPCIEDIKKLSDIINGEVLVYEVNGLPTADQVKTVIEKNCEIYGIDITDKVFSKFNDDIYGGLINSEFKSKKELTDKINQELEEMKEYYVLDSLKSIVNYASVDDFLKDCSFIIKYDEEKYNAINDKDAFMQSFMRNKDNFTSSEIIKDFVDNYKATQTNNKPNKPGSSSGGGGGGSSSSSSSGGNTSVYVPPVTETTGNDNKPAPQSAFKDVSLSHWAYDYILFLNSRSVLTGDENGNICPDNSITRAEFVKMLMESFKSYMGAEEDSVKTDENGNEVKEESLFTDISPDDWYYNYMQKAGKNNIVLGDDGKCMPNDNITREELCTIAYRMVISSGNTLKSTNSALVYKDASSISTWASNAVMNMQISGVLAGGGDFEPKSNATRAQTAKIITQILRNIENN